MEQFAFALLQNHRFLAGSLGHGVWLGGPAQVVGCEQNILAGCAFYAGKEPRIGQRATAVNERVARVIQTQQLRLGVDTGAEVGQFQVFHIVANQ